MKQLPFPQLPSSFYDQSDFLRHVRQAAHSLRVAPDAVLGATLARIATATPPTTYIDTPEPTTLNLIVGLIAPSGDGKSRAQSTARRLLPDLGLGVNDSLPLGTGEGFVDSYFTNVSVLNDSGKASTLRNAKRSRRRYFGATRVKHYLTWVCVKARQFYKQCEPRGLPVYSVALTQVKKRVANLTRTHTAHVSWLRFNRRVARYWSPTVMAVHRNDSYMSRHKT
jgi:hypothetical protein